MNTIFNSIKDHFTAQVFADYFEEHDQPKTARELLAPPQGKNTSLKHDDGCGTGSYGHSRCGSYGEGSYGRYGDGSYGDGNDATFGDGYGTNGNTFQTYQQTLHYQQNSL
jgi:hypothetical protein